MGSRQSSSSFRLLRSLNTAPYIYDPTSMHNPSFHYIPIFHKSVLKLYSLVQTLFVAQLTTLSLQTQVERAISQLLARLFIGVAYIIEIESSVPGIPLSGGDILTDSLQQTSKSNFSNRASLFAPLRRKSGPLITGIIPLLLPNFPNNEEVSCPPVTAHALNIMSGSTNNLHT